MPELREVVKDRYAVARQITAYKPQPSLTLNAPSILSDDSIFCVALITHFTNAHARHYEAVILKTGASQLSRQKIETVLDSARASPPKPLPKDDSRHTQIISLLSAFEAELKSQAAEELKHKERLAAAPASTTTRTLRSRTPKKPPFSPSATTETQRKSTKTKSEAKAPKSSAKGKGKRKRGKGKAKKRTQRKPRATAAASEDVEDEDSDEVVESDEEEEEELETQPPKKKEKKTAPTHHTHPTLPPPTTVPALALVPVRI